MAEWAWQIARQVSGDEEPDELTLDRLLAAEPDAWDSMFVVSTVPRVPIEGGRMPQGVKTTNDQVEMLAKAIKAAGSVNAFARDYVQGDNRTPTAIGQQVRNMLKGKKSLEPGRTLILQAGARAAGGPPDELREHVRQEVEHAGDHVRGPEVIDVEGEPYVKAEPGEVHPELDDIVYVPKEVQVDPTHELHELVDDLTEALREVLLIECSDHARKQTAELQAAKLLLRLDR